MKTHLLPAIKLTMVLIALLVVVYPTMVWAIAQLSSGNGEGQKIEHNGKTYYSNIGQSFTQDAYFLSRPSAVNYNASGSAGSNKGPSNKEYLAEVQQRIDTLLARNPNLEIAQIPTDLITASGSGLDPHISVQAANIQVSRIAAVRNITADKISSIIRSNTEKPIWGLFGPEIINVLKLNVALDQIPTK